MADKKAEAQKTKTDRRQLINESKEVLPGDKARAKDEQKTKHEDEALDTGTTDSTTLGGAKGSS